MKFLYKGLEEPLGRKLSELDGTQNIADALAPPDLGELVERMYQRAQADLIAHLNENLFGGELR